MRVPTVKICLVGLIAAVLTMALISSASAKEVHLLTGRLGAHELSLTEQSGVGIDQETGTVYVADTGHNRIVKYSADGEAQGTLAILTAPTYLAVDNSSGGSQGDIYAVGQGYEAITKLDSFGLPVASWGTAGRMEGFGKIAGIAVGPGGNLFVMNTEAMLRELTAPGTQTSACNLEELGIMRGGVDENGIAVDGEDNVYYTYGIENHETNKVTSPPECRSLGEGENDNQFPKNFNQARGLAVNEADGSTFRTYLSGISHFESDGKEIRPRIGSREGLGEVGQLAVRRNDEAIYAADRTAQDVAVFTLVNVEPPEVTIDPPTGITGTSAHFRAEIDPGAPENDPPAYDVTYEFHCIPECGTGSRLTGTVPAGSEAVTVDAIAEELLPGTEYKVYITAENIAGVSRSPEEPMEGSLFTTGVIAPSIEEAFISGATESTATIAATIHPGGTRAGYRVQYVTQAQFEASEFAGAQETPEEAVSGGAGVQVSVTVPGLSASSPYVVRVVAANTVSTAFGEPLAVVTQGPLLLPAPGSCPNEVFRVGPSAGLADCRAYERSSPAEKNGGGIEGLTGAVQATDGPDSITFFSQAGIPGGVGAQDYPTFISSRGEGAWSTQGLLPPQSYGRKADYLGLTPGGRYAISDAVGLGAEGESLGTGLFRRDLGNGVMTTIVPYDTECGNTFCFALAGASSDGSRIFFESTMALTAGQPGEETTPGQLNLFVWEEESGKVTLVDRDEAGRPLPEGGFGGPYDWLEENLLKGGARENMYVSAVNAISRDGTEAVYTERGEEEGSGQLYVRRGIGSSSPSSVKVSAYHEGRVSSGSELPAAFLEATPDGRYVFFKSKAELTKTAYAGEGFPGESEGSSSLYRYDVTTGKLLDVTSNKVKTGPGVEGMLGASESGQVVYFVAKAVLTSQPGPDGTFPVSGEANLYRWEEGASPAIRFVTTLNGGKIKVPESDARDWSPAAESPELSLGDNDAKTARVDAAGDSVVFSSHRSLTGAPNRASTCVGKENECTEFFRYSTQTNTLDCISCDPTGAKPLGPATIGTAYIQAEDPVETKASPLLSKNLSEDGERFFFQTPDPLAATDENGRSGCTVTDAEHASCMDVYEWEAPGTGSCPRSVINASGGCIYLISSGRSDQPSYFADADREGDDVYFFTSSQLVPGDRDQLYDVYDAREGGGLASQNESPTPPCASRQACQGQQAVAEPSITPGSSGFVGPENPNPPKACKKGLVRKHGKCVKKPKHHRHGRKKKRGKHEKRGGR